eukprot:224138-Prymnesium_polylepis.1
MIIKTIERVTEHGPAIKPNRSPTEQHRSRTSDAREPGCAPHHVASRKALCAQTSPQPSVLRRPDRDRSATCSNARAAAHTARATSRRPAPSERGERQLELPAQVGVVVLHERRAPDGDDGGHRRTAGRVGHAPEERDGARAANEFPHAALPLELVRVGDGQPRLEPEAQPAVVAERARPQLALQRARRRVTVARAEQHIRDLLRRPELAQRADGPRRHGQHARRRQAWQRERCCVLLQQLADGPR